MLKYIFVQDAKDVEGKVSKAISELKAEAGKHSIAVKLLTECGIELSGLDMQENSADVLVIANSDRILEIATKMNMARIEVLTATNSKEKVFGAQYAVEDMEALNYTFVQMVYHRYHKIPLTIMLTERCIVREMSVEDRNEMVKCYEDSCLDYLGALSEIEKKQEFVQAYIQSMYGFYGYGMWLVFDKINTTMVGRIGFENLNLNGWSIEDKKAKEYIKGKIDAGSLLPEFGYMIRKQYERQGITLEISKALMEYASDELEFDSIFCRIEEKNIASQRLSEKLGFEFLTKIEKSGKNVLLYQFNNKERKLLENK